MLENLKLWLYDHTGIGGLAVAVTVLVLVAVPLSIQTGPAGPVVGTVTGFAGRQGLKANRLYAIVSIGDQTARFEVVADQGCKIGKSVKLWRTQHLWGTRYQLRPGGCLG
jgi:hypothetical protein